MVFDYCQRALQTHCRGIHETFVDECGLRQSEIGFHYDIFRDYYANLLFFGTLRLAGIALSAFLALVTLLFLCFAKEKVTKRKAIFGQMLRHRYSRR
jgi:hypothetical protein